MNHVCKYEGSCPKCANFINSLDSKRRSLKVPLLYKCKTEGCQNQLSLVAHKGGNPKHFCPSCISKRRSLQQTWYYKSPKPTEPRFCVWCNKDISGMNRQARFCSYKCWLNVNRYKKKKNCMTCGISLLNIPKRRKYCTQACCLINMYMKKRGITEVKI